MSGPRRVDARGAATGDLDWAPILEHLRDDGLVAYPTETVYGFGGIPSEGVIAKLSALKLRPTTKPVLMLISGRDEVPGLRWTDEAIELASIFWPGSLTLILSDPNERFPEGVRGPSGAVAVRMSPHPLVTTLLEGLGAPLLSTSANAPGQPPALDAAGAEASARALGADEDLWILDGGVLPPSAPSTIVDCSGDTPIVVRQGTIPLGRVRCVLPDITGTPDTMGAVSDA